MISITYSPPDVIVISLSIEVPVSSSALHEPYITSSFTVPVSSFEGVKSASVADGSNGSNGSNGFHGSNGTGIFWLAVNSTGQHGLGIEGTKLPFESNVPRPALALLFKALRVDVDSAPTPEPGVYLFTRFVLTLPVKSNLLWPPGTVGIYKLII